MFNHNPLTEFDLPRVDIEGKRHYTDGKVYYPSNTTVLSYKDNSALEEWKARVGEVEAARVSARACTRGTELHLLAEHYLQNKPLKLDFDSAPRFNKFKPVLNRIDNIRLQEAPLISHKVKIAGSVDCIADFDGKLSIIDFKTSARPKEKDWIDSYFIQTTFYALACYEMYGIKISQLAILIAVEDSDPQIFLESPSNWLDKLIEARSICPL